MAQRGRSLGRINHSGSRDKRFTACACTCECVCVCVSAVRSECEGSSQHPERDLREMSAPEMNHLNIKYDTHTFGETFRGDGTAPEPYFPGEKLRCCVTGAGGFIASSPQG